MPKITITDIDGTIIDRGQPVEAVLDYIDELDFDVFVLTNRPESDRAKTIKDLEEADLDYSRLIMNGGSMPAPEFKKSEVQKLLDEGYDPQVFIDNDEANRKAVGSLGVETLDPADIVKASQMENDNSEAVANLTKYMTIEEQLVKAVADLSGLTSERDELRANVEALVAKENEGTAKLVADLDASNKKLADIEVAFNALSAEKTELLKQISELSAKQVSASVEAAKIASSVGVAPVELSPADKATDEPAKAVNHLEVFLAMPMGAERSAYFAKHKNEIVRSI